MKDVISAILVCFVFFQLSCKYSSIQNRIANEEYKDDILNKYDSIFIDHFPVRIETEPVSFGGRIENAHTEHSVFLITKYPQKIVDTLYQYYQQNSIQQYEATQKNLLVVNRFTNDDNWYKKEIATEAEIRHYTQEVCYEDKLPVPNFWDRSYITGDTECNIDSTFKLFIIEAKSGKCFSDSLLSQGTYMPKEWKHGMSRGVGISKKSGKVVFWLVFW